MLGDYFDFAPQIAAEEKYLDRSRSEIVRKLETTGAFDEEWDYTTVDDYANKVTVVLRVNISCKDATHPEGWTFSLKLHNTRIDGVDHEEKYVADDGSIQSGWHRHKWNPRKRSAERDKVPTKDLDGVSNREEFVIRAMKLTRITLSATDYGTGLLQFD